MLTQTDNNKLVCSQNIWQRFITSKIYPWVIISVCAGLLFYKYILNVFPSIMSHELMREFQVNGAQLGNLAATFFYSYTIVQLFAGILLDKFGARLITGCSVIVGALGAWIFASATDLHVAQIARAMMGFGVAFATVTYLKMVAVWFKPNQMAFVGGLLTTAVMAGAVFGQAPLAIMLEHTSWRFVLQFCSILGLVIAALFIIFVRDQPPTKELAKNTVIDHLHHDLHQGFSFNEVLKVLKNKQNWLLTFYSGLAFAPLSVLGGLWGPPFIQEAFQLSRDQSAALVSLMFIGLGVGSPILGLLSDRLGKRLGVMKFGVLLSLVCLVAVIYTPHLPIWLVGSLLFLLGCGVGAFMLGFTVGSQINAIPLAATVVALINTGDSIFESFTEPLLGKLLDLGWSGQMVDGARYFTINNYHWAFTPLPLYFLTAFVLLYFIKEPIIKVPK